MLTTFHFALTFSKNRNLQGIFFLSSFPFFQMRTCPALGRGQTSRPPSCNQDKQSGGVEGRSGQTSLLPGQRPVTTGHNARPTFTAAVLSSGRLSREYCRQNTQK